MRKGYAPIGEPYEQTGNGEISLPARPKDTVWLQYDFLFRQHDPKQERWISPDPAGLGAVSFANPQSWNRYAYVQNSPLNATDPSGLACFGPQKSLGLCNTAAGFGANPPFGSNWDPFYLLTHTLCYGEARETGCGTWINPNFLFWLSFLGQRRDVDKTWSRTFPCNKNAQRVMAAVQNDMGQFADNRNTVVATNFPN